VRPLLVGLLVLACAPATASAAAFSFPGPEGAAPRALAFGGDGRGAVVTERAGVQEVVTVPAGRRTTYTDTVLLDAARRSDGGADLLVRRGADPTRAGDLMLRRVLPSGRVLDLWSVRSLATRGAVARRGDRTYVAWQRGSALRLVARRDGGLPTRPRTARLGLSGFASLDLAVDPAGRLVAAATSPQAGLVLASLTSSGRVVRRQVVRGASGLVEVAVTARGRVGVLVEDTGIEGDFGECVADGGGRHVRAVVRGRGAARFGSLQTIESPRFGCGSSGALLRATPGDSLTVLYQGGSYDHPPLLVRRATAAPGRRFGAPETLASDARADSALVTRAGDLVAALLRRAESPEVYAGALSLLAPDREDQVAPRGASAPLVGLDGGGAPVLAWMAGGTLQVRTGGLDHL
jgi:hypothetical protein